MITNEKKEFKTKLSASKINTLQSCSWIFWCTYFLNLPDRTNSGAIRGKIVHDLFEILTKSKKLVFAKELSNGCHSSILNRFIRIKAYIYNLNLFELVKNSKKTNLELILEMINVGLSCDFFPNENEQIIDSEYNFNLEFNDDIKYKITGFIDRILFNKETEELLITDYKSSKALFEGDKLEANIQAMIYSLAAHELKKIDKLPLFKKVLVRFIFLRFAKNPYQTLEYSYQELEGFKYYLEYLQNAIDNFTEEDAKSDFAADDKDRAWLCGRAKYPGDLKKDGSLIYHCQYKFEFTYYVLLDKNRKIKMSLFEDDFFKKRDIIKLLDGDFWEKRNYSGCPKYNKYGK